MGDRQGPSSNHDQVGAGLGVPKAHPHYPDWRKGRLYPDSRKNHQDKAKLKLIFLLTGDKTEVLDQTLYSN